jgi:hypothetical protein
MHVMHSGAKWLPPLQPLLKTPPSLSSAASIPRQRGTTGTARRAPCHINDSATACHPRPELRCWRHRTSSRSGPALKGRPLEFWGLQSTPPLGTVRTVAPPCTELPSNVSAAGRCMFLLSPELERNERALRAVASEISDSVELPIARSQPRTVARHRHLEAPQLPPGTRMATDRTGPRWVRR